MKGRLLEVTYEDFINNILETRGRNGCGDEYHETHHIVPKCMDGSNDKENLIDLFAREHFEAHRLLALENPDVQGLVYAWWAMSVQTNEYTKERYRITEEEYEEVRKAYSKIASINMRGNNHPMYGKCHTDESREKMSKSHKGKISPRKGAKLSFETKGLLSKINKGKNSGEKCYRSHKVAQYNLNGNLIKVWNYIKQATNELGINHATISGCCRGKYKTAGGFIWRYIEDINNVPSKIEVIKPKTNPNSKSILCIETNIIYKSIGDTAKQTGINRKCISNCLNGRSKTAGKYHWQFI